MLGADVCAVRLEEEDAPARDLRQIRLHEVVGTAAPQPVAERDDFVGGEIGWCILHAEEVGARSARDFFGDCLCIACGG